MTPIVAASFCFEEGDDKYTVQFYRIWPGLIDIIKEKKDHPGYKAQLFPISNSQIEWDACMTLSWISENARKFADRVAKLRTFI